jgi:transcriptional regulator with XRE-family HTH domain
MTIEEFATRLTQLRLEKGVSARDMSLSLGQSEAYINRIENQKMLPSMTVFFYICEYFSITPAEFFHETAPSAELLDAARKLGALSEEKRQHIIAIIDDLSAQSM